jgi:hypothetical protein
MASPNDQREIKSKRTTEVVGLYAVAHPPPANKHKDIRTPRRIEIKAGAPIGAQACFFNSLSPMAHQSPMAQHLTKQISLESPFRSPGPSEVSVSFK